MAVDLGVLQYRMQTTGGASVISDLKGVEAQGVKTAASLNGLSGSLDRAASATLNGTKGYKDLSGAYANQDAVLATLTPKVEENGKKLEESTKKAKAHNETLHGLWGTIKQLGEAYLVFEGLHFIGEAVEQAAALHELSQKTGVAADTLSVLQFAGRRANVTVEQLGTAFRGMALALGRARDGVDITEGALAKLGFTAKDFQGLSPEEQFLKLAIAVGGYKDATERAELASKVFGRAGANLVPMLEDLAVNGFAKTREEAEKFHAVISQDMADAADKAEDDWRDIVDMFKGMARSTIPLLADAVRALYELLNSGPGDTWRNTMREITGAVDGATRLATLGFFGTHLSDNFSRLPGARDKADPGGFRGDGLGMGTRAPGAITDPIAPVPQLSKEAQELALRQKEEARKAYAASVLGLANMDESMRAVDRLDFLGMGGPVATRAPIGTMGTVNAVGASASAQINRPGIRFMDTLKQDLFDGLQRLQPFAVGLQGFFEQMFATGKIGASLKQFGKNILAGMGSIFSQMAVKAIAAAPIFQAIGAAMSNPFTAGAALLAFGIALKALGASMGATATGGDSGGSGGFGDRTTNITLTPAGAGGMVAPHSEVGPKINVLGANSPEGQRLFGEHAAAAKRSRNM